MVCTASKQKASLLNNFNKFINEFQEKFGDTNSVWMTISRFRRLHWGRLAWLNIRNKFLSSWLQYSNMEIFRHGLCDDEKGLPMTFHGDPKSLTMAISRVI